MTLRFNIDSITPVSGGGGGGSAKKYGVDINAVLGDVDANGVLQPANVDADIVFTGVKKLNGSYTSNVLREAFYSTGIKSVSFPDLEEFDSSYDGNSAFSRCPNLKTFSVPKLKTIKGSFFSGALQYSGIESLSFPALETLTLGSISDVADYSSIESLSFPELTELSGWDYGIIRIYQCSNLASASFPKLKTIARLINLADNTTYATPKISVSNAGELESIEFPSLDSIQMNRAMNFSFCSKLKHIYFPALKTTSFVTGLTDFGYNMLQGVTGCTVHFPIPLYPVLFNWSSVTNGFGGTNTTVLFDLGTYYYDNTDEMLIFGNGYMKEQLARVWSGETLAAIESLLGNNNVDIDIGGGQAVYVEAFDRSANEVFPSGFPLYAFMDTDGTYSLVASAGDGMFIIRKNDPDYATIMENGIMLAEDFCTMADGVITTN